MLRASLNGVLRSLIQQFLNFNVESLLRAPWRQEAWMSNLYSMHDEPISEDVCRQCVNVIVGTVVQAGFIPHTASWREMHLI